MRKLKGFTLAEVLVTLGIVGVIAALTIPALYNHIERDQTGPKLMKAIKTIEDANRVALSDNDVRSLDRIPNNANNADYIGTVMSRYVPGGVGGALGTYRTYQGQDAPIPQTANYVSKDGITYAVSLNSLFTPAPAAAVQANPNYMGRYMVMYVDLNGTDTPPNIIGNDTFEFFVDMYGQVIPYGSNQFVQYLGNNNLAQNNFWNGNQNKCNADEVVGTGFSCSGSIVDNGGKVVYEF